MVMVAVLLELQQCVLAITMETVMSALTGSKR